MIKFIKKLIEEYKEGNAKDKLSIVSSFFTIFGMSLVTLFTSYFVDEYKINLLGIFFICLAEDLGYIVVFLIVSSIVFKVREYIKKWFPSFGLIIFYTLYALLVCGFIGMILRYGSDITFIFRRNL
ncbi:hypothetical protein [Clostridium beijerinckii]|uniref:hypothetical protein n=1 Tax=Clostridium beijerinckii TaxID=1520 RepID=UPI001F254D0C|nr:hypothetical protein [Clostridium beijerinckii]